MTTSDPAYHAVVLAALLHDVGKVGQRGRAPLTAQYAGDANAVLGSRARHARWSAGAFDEIVPPIWSAGAEMVFTHHLPRSYETKIVAVADRLTSSADDDAEADDLPAGVGRLVPIFSRVHADLHPPRAATFIPLAPLHFDRATLYPRATHSGEIRAEYGRLWSGFLAEARGNREASDFETFLTTLLGLLEKYTWCVPTGTTTNLPDVSL